eukprot:Pgem_evm1s19466
MYTNSFLHLCRGENDLDSIFTKPLSVSKYYFLNRKYNTNTRNITNVYEGNICEILGTM